MKSAVRMLSLLMTLIVIACNSFDQDAFDQGLEDSQKPSYIVPNTIPATEIQFKQSLHGEDKKAWIAQEFKLEGLLGDQDCRLDDSMVLSLDGTYQFDAGSMSCGGNDLKTKSGVYRVDYGNHKLIFDEGTSDEVSVTVSGLDQGVISLKGEVDIFGVSMDIKGVYTVE